MTTKYDKLDETFNTTSTEVSSEVVVDESGVSVGVDREKPDRLSKDDITRDYEYTRGNLYSIIEKGQEAINGILDVAEQSDMPRAYEVAGQLIKTVTETNQQFMDLQKKVEEIKNMDKKLGNTNIENALFFLMVKLAQVKPLLLEAILNYLI